LEGSSLFIDNNNTNYENYNISKDTTTTNSSSSDPVNFDSYDFNMPFTRVYYGSIDAYNALLKFIDRSTKKIDSCISSIGPSVIIEVKEIKNKRVDAVGNRGLKLRYVTEITKDNIDYIKQMLTFSEIRHLDGIKGNFEVSDEKEYVAVATLKKAQPIPQLIFSNVPEVVEQQQFVFDSFWERAIPAEQKLKEIEKGIIHPITTVFSDYKDAEKIEFEMIKNATKEIQILYSTSNAFYLQEKSGILQLLKEVAEQNSNNLYINILLPIDSSIKKSLSFNLLNKNLKNNNIVFQDIAPSINIKIKSLVVDRKESLIMELKHLREEKHTASIGFSIYSNSQSIVLSYASIFEVLYNQSILFDQMKEEENIRSEFINIAAHELRTPIMPILNGMEILEENLGEKEKEKHKKEIDIITRNASRLQNLAESILQVSRIESGKFSLNIQKDVDIHSLILQVIEDIEKKYMYTQKAKKVSIVFVPYNGEKPEDQNTGNSNIVSDEIEKKEENDNKKKTTTYHPLYVDCDAQKISQVVFNLLDNAIKFTAEGQISVYTTTSYQKTTDTIHPHRNKKMSLDNNNSNSNDDDDDAVANKTSTSDYIDRNKNSIIVTVEDVGTGINKKIKDQLFEKFATKSTQGTGLGLYLSKKIVEAHGGKIWYEEPNEAAITSLRKSNWNSNDGDDVNDDIRKHDHDQHDHNPQPQKAGSIFRFRLLAKFY
jgi:two-component system sensor histidine kinase VicK